MAQPSPKILPPKLILYKDHLIKVYEETDVIFTGYDIFTEKLMFLPKDANAIELPKIVYDILKNETKRIKLAMVLCPTRKKASKMINVSERTVYRMMKKFDLPRRKLNAKPKKLNKSV